MNEGKIKPIRSRPNQTAKNHQKQVSNNT